MIASIYTTCGPLQLVGGVQCSEDYALSVQWTHAALLLAKPVTRGARRARPAAATAHNYNRALFARVHPSVRPMRGVKSVKYGIARYYKRYCHSLSRPCDNRHRTTIGGAIKRVNSVTFPKKVGAWFLRFYTLVGSASAVKIWCKKHCPYNDIVKRFV